MAKVTGSVVAPAASVADNAIMSQLTQATDGMELQTSGFSSYGISPYIWFPHANSSLWASAIRQIPELSGNMACLVVGQKIYTLKQFRFITLASTHFLVQEDGMGQAVRVFEEAAPAKLKVSEWFETVLYVFNDDGCRLARCRFARTKTGGIKAVLEEIKAASSADWIKGDQSRKYAASLPEPRFRVMGEFQIVTKTSRSTGLPYQILVGAAKPTGTSDMLALKDYIQSETYQQEYVDIQRDYHRTLAEMRSKR